MINRPKPKLPVISNPQLLHGDCLACSRIAVCTDTSVQKVEESFTCTLFTGVEEPVYYARLAMIENYGSRRAIEAMLQRSDEGEEE